MKNRLYSTMSAFYQEISEIIKKRNDIVILDTDITTSNDPCYIDKLFKMGNAEQNMMSIAGGIASTQKIIPFAITLASFESKKVCQQISTSIAPSKLNVKIVGLLGGASACNPEIIYHSFEDIANMRSIPNMTIIIPSDAIEMKKAIRACIKYDGPVYLRCIFHDTPVIFGKDYLFKWGKGVILRNGKDVTIVSTGIMASQAKIATNILVNKGIDVNLLHLHTIKPIDKDIILKAAIKTECIVTVENHSIIGGLGSAVSELLSENTPRLIKRIGIEDVFVKSGSLKDLFCKYGLTYTNIVTQVEDLLLKKRKIFFQNKLLVKS